MNSTVYPPNVTSPLPNTTTTTLLSSLESSNPGHVKLIFLLLYIIIALIGFTGNCSTVYIIVKQKYMRKSIHFYTLNMAIADLIVIVFYVPVEIIKNQKDMVWTMGEPLCRITYCIIPLSLAASISTLVAITFNRHRGLSKPLEWRNDTNSVIKTSIPLIWLAGFVTCIPFMYVVVLKEHPVHSGNYYCYEQWGSLYSERAYWVTMFCLQFLLPLFVMTILNVHMLIIMGRLNTRHKKVHKRILRMVIVLVVVYAVCTSPQHIVYFWLSHGDLSRVDVELQQIIFKIENLLLIIKIAMNPVIYGTIGELRKSFSRILRLARSGIVQSLRQVSSCEKHASEDERSHSLSPTLTNRHRSKETLKKDNLLLESDV